MKLLNEIKNKLLNDVSLQLDDKKTKETILNILILPIIHHLKNEIINKYLNNNDLEIDKQKNNLYAIIIENINDYFYKELYPFFLFLFIMVILLFILVLVVIVIILKLNIKKV